MSQLIGSNIILAAAAAAAKSCQVCLTLCNPIDGSPPGSPIPGVLQARALEWVAISFSYAWKWKVKVKSLSHVWLFLTPWTAAYQAPLSMGFSRLRVLEWGAIAFSKTSFLLDPKCYGHTHSSELKWTVRATLVKTLHSCSKRPTK